MTKHPPSCDRNRSQQSGLSQTVLARFSLRLIVNSKYLPESDSAYDLPAIDNSGFHVKQVLRLRLGSIQFVSFETTLRSSTKATNLHGRACDDLFQKKVGGSSFDHLPDCIDLISTVDCQIEFPDFI
jgi:hypothetical protein